MEYNGVASESSISTIHDVMVWEPLSEMFPLRQEGYLMLIRINKQHLILNEEMKREIGYFIKKTSDRYIVNYISGQRNRKSAGCVGLVRIKN